MKKIVFRCSLFLFTLLGCFIFSSCKKDISLNISFSELDLFEGETYEIEYQVENVNKYEIEYVLSNDNIAIDDDLITTKTPGTCEVTMVLKSGKVEKKVSFIVNVLSLMPSSLVVETPCTFILGTVNQLNWQILPSYASQEVEFKSYNEKIVNIKENGQVECIGLGSTNVHVVSKSDQTIRKIIKIFVVRPDVVSIEGDTEAVVEFKNTVKLNWQVNSSYALQDVGFEVENEKIVSVDSEGVVSGLCPGKTKVKIISLDNEKIYLEVDVTVIGEVAERIECESEISVNIGEKYKINYSVYPSTVYQYVSFSNSDDLEIDENEVLIGCKGGTYNLTLSTIDGSNLSKQITINVIGASHPTFVFYDTEQNLILNWNDEFNPLSGIRVFDSEDGELTSQIKIDNEVDSSSYGTYVLKYSVKDSDGNETTLERTIEVVWNYAVTFIGHGGCYYGAFNSEEAILYAIKVLKYQAIEVDLKQTKDGVFILSHDPTFGGYNLEDCTWDELKDVEITETRKSGIPGSNGSVEGNGTYKAKLCTLDRFLQICKEYNIKAVIELKTSAGISNWCEQNTPTASKMPTLIKKIEDAGMINNVILLSSQYECLAWTRKNGYEFVECQYLVSCCQSEEYLNICIKYNLDISMNVRDGIVNSDEWLKKYKDAGLKIAAYTFEEYASYEVLQSYIDRGFDYVTTDWHVISELKLPKKE